MPGIWRLTYSEASMSVKTAMTNDDYTRLKFEIRRGRYLFTWRLMTFPLASSWRQRRRPSQIDWEVLLENPPEEEVEAIAKMRLHLADHPEDTMNQFILGNMLRMNGQTAAAREQYEQVALTGQGHWVQQAKDIFVELEGVPEYLPGRSYHVIYHNSLHRMNPEKTRRYRVSGKIQV